MQSLNDKIFIPWDLGLVDKACELRRFGIGPGSRYASVQAVIEV